MRIRTYCKYIDTIASIGHKLNDSTLVIDGLNVLYRFYAERGLQFVFGCESDVYAETLREYLGMFKKANVKCYFIFKGGHEDIETKFSRMPDKLTGHNFVFGAEQNNIVQPIFIKDVYLQVLDEMGFDYVLCEYESKREIIAMAQKLNCSVCSYDIEYSFSGVPYVPHPSIHYNQDENVLSCSLFTMDNLQHQFRSRLTPSLLATFVVLTDIKIFPENHFMKFINTLKIPIGNYKRNLGILNWLSRTPRQRALEHIFRFISSEDRKKFLEEEIKARSMILRQETPGLPTEYLENGKVQITEKDPQWFIKGVVSKHIALPYINLYRSNILLGSWVIADKDADDAILPSMKIIKYAYNLLTNFKKEDFTLVTHATKDKIDKCQCHESISVSVTDCVQKPNYDAIDSPFENGWDDVKRLGLFEHFIEETLPGFDLGRLENLPENAKLLLIASVYYSHQRPTETSNETCSFLLCYVALSVLKDNDSTTDTNLINAHDKRVATNILATYFTEVTMDEAEKIFNSKLIHPLVEFQHCLENLNYLNRLCGCPFKPTIYSKTLNGTFVYKILRDIVNENEGNCFEFINKLLNPAASVLVFLNSLIDLYEDLM